MYRSKIRRSCKRILAVILSLLLLLCLFPSFSLRTLAEGDDEATQSEEVGEEEGYGVLTEGSVKVGDIIKFGHYEQDFDESNGKEEIEWQVLKVESDKVLVVSKYALDCKPYNTENTDVTWETCFLRGWLNNDFKNAAFSSAEQAKIPTVTIENKDNPYGGAAGGNNTNDQIFCLSLEEMESYFGNYSYYSSEKMYGYNQNLICAPTQYAMNNNDANFYDNFYDITEHDYNSDLKDKGYTSDVIGRRGSCWWLRSPGGKSKDACFVNSIGIAGAGCNRWVNFPVFVVRPAMYINLSSVDPEPSDSKEIVYSGTSAVTHEPFSYTTTFSPSDLSMPASKSNYNLAMVCGMLSKAVYHDANQEEDKNILKQMGIEGYDPHFEGKSWNYSFGYDSFMLNGVDTNVIVISIKGTNSEDEIAADRIMDAGRYKMYGYRVFDFPYSFKEEIKLHLNDLANNHSELKTKPLKIIVTGHSLGGATANLLAAELTAEKNEWYSDLLDKEDVFCYTFGAIDAKDAADPNHPGTVRAGFENIHNIYNVLDTFGWFGNVGIATTNGNGIFGKFGHMDFFKIDVKDKELNLLGDTKGYNHDIVLYMDAVYQRLISWEWETSGMPRIYTVIRCPVDVEVYDGDTLVGRVVNDVVDKDVSTISICCVEHEKYIFFDQEGDYRIKITATDAGSMEFGVFNADTGTAFKACTNIPLEEGKQFGSNVGTDIETEEAKLYVIDDSGTPIAEVKEDGKEVPVKDNPKVQDIFKDVNEGDWFIPYVQYAYDNNLMSGKGENFAPNDPLRREEFTQILYSHSGKPAVDFENPFADVKKDWYTNSVLWAKQNGIADGKTKNGKNVFGVGQNITREELALMIYKYAKLKNYDLERTEGATEGFSDSNKVSSWSKEALEWAVTQGIIGGKGKSGAPKSELKIDPQGKASRAECACMIANLLQKNAKE